MTSRSGVDGRQLILAAAGALLVVAVAVAYALSAYTAGPLALPAAVGAVVLAGVALARPPLGVAGALVAVAAEGVGLPLPSGALSPAEAGIALIGLGYGARLLLAPATVRAPEARDLPLAVLLGAVLAGLLVAVDTAPVLRVTLLWGTFALAFLQVRQFTPHEVRVVVAAFAVGAGVLGGLGTYGYLTAGGPRLYAGGQATGARALGTFDDANYFASLLVLAVLPGLALALSDLRRHWWLMAPVGLGAAGIAFSLSRGGLLGLLAGLLVLLLWRRARRWAFALLLVAGTLTALNLNPLVRSEQVQVVSQRLSTVSNQGQVSLRPRIWRAAASATVDSPVVGVGVNNFRYVASANGVVERGSPLENAHSLPFSLAAETGLLGLGAFTAFLLLLGRDAISAGRRRLGDPGTQALRVGVGAGLAGFLLQALTIMPLRTQVVAGAFFVTCGLLAALSRPASASATA